MIYDVFMDWFVGRFNNAEQATSNPRECAYINVVHEKISENAVRCTYRYNKERQPYRDVTVRIFQKDHLIYVQNPIADLHFRLEGGVFVTHESHPYLKEGKKEVLVTKAVLGKDHYFVNDSGYDPETGLHLWGLDEDKYFLFKKIS